MKRDNLVFAQSDDSAGHISYSIEACLEILGDGDDQKCRWDELTSLTFNGVHYDAKKIAAGTYGAVFIGVDKANAVPPICIKIQHIYTNHKSVKMPYKLGLEETNCFVNEINWVTKLGQFMGAAYGHIPLSERDICRFAAASSVDYATVKRFKYPLAFFMRCYLKSTVQNPLPAPTLYARLLELKHEHADNKWLLVSHLVYLLVASASAIHELHVVHDCIHCDVKFKNLLLVQNAGGKDCVKLVDHGFSRVRGKALEHFPRPRYLAPEHANWPTPPATPAVDVFAFGSMLYDSLKLFGLLYVGCPASVAPLFCALVTACQNETPRYRPSMNVIIERLRTIQRIAVKNLKPDQQEKMLERMGSEWCARGVSAGAGQQLLCVEHKQ